MTNREAFSWVQRNVNEKTVISKTPIVLDWHFIRNKIVNTVDRVLSPLKREVRGAQRFDKP